RLIDRELTAEAPRADRNWYVNREGHTMVVVASHPGLTRTFVIGSQEVTIAQFLNFRDDHKTHPPYSHRDDCPVGIVTWYDAAAYCRWISEQEQIPENEMCYPPLREIKDGMVPFPNYLERTGYRLPTEDEWNEACAAGARTKRFFGESPALMPW